MDEAIAPYRSLRQRGLEAHASGPWEPSGFDADRLRLSGDESLTEATVSHIAGLLVRRSGHANGGAVVIRGIRWPAVPEARYQKHEDLFRSVWASYRGLTGLRVAGSIGTKVIDDGHIPTGLYGTAWTFKQLHADSKAELFSHLFGPMQGHGGGHIMLVDMRAYLSQVRLTFDEVFEWGAELHPGAKPTVRSFHAKAAIEGFGVNLGALVDGDVLMVNNSPKAGIFHAATPVSIVSDDNFRRVYHRCRASAHN